jgi:hydroxymethylpyrimidine/phosphomethylpyrimidine kinase
VPQPGELIAEQLRAVVEDIPPLAAKSGALGNLEAVQALADLAKQFRFPLVVDPVMVSKHGHRLLSDDAERALKDKLLPHAFLATPNIPEAETLADMQIYSETDMRRAGERILRYGCKAVLVKGGHLPGEPVDVLCWPGGASSGAISRYPANRVPTAHTHGTGCTYSAAITAALALGKALPEAILLARQYLQRAIETAPGLGHGQGPVNHFARV